MFVILFSCYVSNSFICPSTASGVFAFFTVALAGLSGHLELLFFAYAPSKWVIEGHNHLNSVYLIAIACPFEHFQVYWYLGWICLASNSVLRRLVNLIICTLYTPCSVISSHLPNGPASLRHLSLGWHIHNSQVQHFLLAQLCNWAEQTNAPIRPSIQHGHLAVLSRAQAPRRTPLPDSRSSGIPNA